MMARDGEARALRPFCKNVPDLQMNHPKTYDTIPIVIYFVYKPSEHSIFAMAIPSGTGAVMLAQGGHTG